MQTSLYYCYIFFFLIAGICSSCQKKLIENNISASNQGFSSSTNSIQEGSNFDGQNSEIYTSASAGGIEPAQMSILKNPTQDITIANPGLYKQQASENSKRKITETNARSLKKEIRQEIKQLKKRNEAHYALFSKGVGIALIIGGLVLIVLGIAFLNSLGVLLGSVIAGVGVIVFLLGFLGLIL